MQNNLHGYHPYRGGLRLWDGEKLKALEQESELIASLVNPSEYAWLIHPKEINQILKEKIDELF